MTTPIQPLSDRIVTLDFIRGVAVMGILLANLPAFALPEAAYFSPAAWGGRSTADLIAWGATFLLIEGKLRGLFTMLFGASALLVIERARSTGDDPTATHIRRMIVLLVIGCAHLYLFWWGDILSHYALVGAVLLLFARLPARWLVFVGLALLGWQMLADTQTTLALFASAGKATPAARALWDGVTDGFGTPPRARLLAEIAANRAGFWAEAAWRWREAPSPLAFAIARWPETLGLMLLGMAGLRSGFLSGQWTRRRYRMCATAGIATGLAMAAPLGWLGITHDFDQRWIYLASVGAALPPHVAMTIGYAALLALLCRPDGAATRRIAAVGRAAFTNYLGTTLVMTGIFSGWGMGLFGTLTRAELYLLAPPVWAAMLIWSPWWLARYRHGPLEWLWRSLARLEWQKMRMRRNLVAIELQ